MALRVSPYSHDADDGDERGGQATQVAFEDLWKHRAALRDICQRIVGDAATADDMVQETYLRAFRNLDSLERRPSLMPWLATVARRRSIDELRRRGYQQPVEEVPDEGTTPEYDPGETAAVNETVSQVREALTALTNRERHLLVRQVNQGLSLVELAEFEDSSVASVRSVLSRARMKLRDALSDVGTRVLAPLGPLGAWLKRKTTDLNVKVQQASPLVGGSYDRLGEIATASVTAAALAVGGALVPAGAATGEDDGTAIETVEVSSAYGAPSTVPSDTAFPTSWSTDEAVPAASAVKPEKQSESAFRVSTQGPGDAGEGVAGFPTLDNGEPGNERHAPKPSSENPVEEDADGPGDADFTDIDIAHNGQLMALGQARDCEVDLCSVLFASEDGGRTWIRLEARGLEATQLLLPPTYPDINRIYALGPDGLQISVDGGESFGQITGATFTKHGAISPSFADDDRILGGDAPGWEFDAEKEFARPGPYEGLPGNEVVFSFAHDYADTGVAFASSTYLGPDGWWQAGVYACTEDGCSDPVALDGLRELAEVEAVDGAIAAWKGQQLWLSTDGGSTFEQPELPNHGRITGVAGAGSVLFLGTELSAQNQQGGLFKRASDGTWLSVGAGTALADGVKTVSILDSGEVLAAPVTGGFLCSADGGATWAPTCE